MNHDKRDIPKDITEIVAQQDLRDKYPSMNLITKGFMINAACPDVSEVKYSDKIITLIIMTLIKVLIWMSEKNIFLLPLKNFIYAIKGKLPKTINIIA